MAVVVEVGFKDGFQDQPHAFLDHFVARRRYSERAVFSFGLFPDVDPPDGGRPVLLLGEQLDGLVDFFHTEAVQCLTICSRRHIARLALEPFIGQDV